jgi:hypothetical protein
MILNSIPPKIIPDWVHVCVGKRKRILVDGTISASQKAGSWLSKMVNAEAGTPFIASLNRRTEEMVDAPNFNS